VKVLVTGSNGFLGSDTVASLLRHGERDIRCLVRQGGRWSHLEALAKKHEGATVEIMVGNLASRADAARAVKGVGAVYHLAAAMSGAPADMFMNSVVSSKNLLEAIVQENKDIRVVLVSSFGVYGVAGVPEKGVVTEDTPLDPHPEQRDVYSHTKVRQERLFWDYHKRHGVPLVVLRPGVVYGKGGAPVASKVGFDVFGVFLELGGDNPLPLTYVENCADAIVVAGQKAPDGSAYNVVDDELPTCHDYFVRYKREVKRVRSVRIPYPLLVQMSKAVKWYCDYSEGQLPPVFTPYKVSAMWKNVGVANDRIKALGWKQAIPTDEALRRAFEHLRGAASSSSS
jgi:nucleoside-diphosphate-sugar epimerase